MLEDTENQDSNPEGDQGTTPESESSSADEVAKAKEYAKNQKIRAEKAEKELKKLQAEKAKEPKHEAPKEELSNEPDYAKEAYLEQRGVKHPDDKKLVYEEAKRLKMSLTDVLGMEHIEAKLKKAKTQREAEDGMPESGGKPGGVNKNSVEHWVDKKDKDGNYISPPVEMGLEFTNKVIDARVKKEEKGNMFSQDLF